MTKAKICPDISLFDHGQVFPLRSSISFILGTKSRQTTQVGKEDSLYFSLFMGKWLGEDLFSELQHGGPHTAGDTGAAPMGALEVRSVFCRVPSRAKAGA